MALATQGAAVQRCLEGCPATAGMVPPAREVWRAARLRASCHMTWSCRLSPAAIQPSPQPGALPTPPLPLQPPQLMDLLHSKAPGCHSG